MSETFIFIEKLEMDNEQLSISIPFCIRKIDCVMFNLKAER